MLLGLVALVFGWLLLSLLLFLLSSHFERISPPANVASALEPAGYPLTSVNNILVLGSDRREKGSKEPGANTSGPSRSDTIMLVRTGGGHSAKLSIPRDTVIEIPGHGLQKINAAYAFGGPRTSIEVIKRWLGVPINHVVEVNFEDFPALIDSMGGVTYTGSCIFSKIAGGARNGGWTLRLPRGTHHIDGREALIIARTRHNLCAPSQDDINREEHQQAIFQAMKSQLLSPTAFLRLPLISWNAPPAIISDMSGPTLLGLFASLAIEGNSPTKVLRPTARSRSLTAKKASRSRRKRRSGTCGNSWQAEPAREAQHAATGCQARLRRDGLALALLRGLGASIRLSLTTCSPRSKPELESEEAFESPSEEEVPESLVLVLSRWRRRVP